MSISMLPSVPKMVKTFDTVHLLTAERGTGEILSDRKPNGKERPWKTYKRLGTFLYQLYGRAREIDESCISPSAYLALERCCSWLLFRRYVEGSVLKLHKADFCRHRLCPVCNWRKSLKLFSQMKEVSARLLQDFPGARYLFLTLTVKNCSGAELAQTIDKMNFGFKLLANAGKTNASAKAVKANLLGYAKAMEIKYDAEKTITPEMYAQRKKYYIERGLKAGSPNPNYGMYHPHFHVLLMVKPSFFTGKGYVKQEQWAEIWQDCMKLDYTPQVDIRAIKPNKRATEESAADAAMTAAISETMKYPIKPDSLKLDAVESMSEKEKDELAEAIICLSHAMKGRRLVTFGGEILKARKALKQDDIEKGDLVEVGDTPTIENEYEFVLFNWMKMGCYVC